nr:hypothetical protein [Tanacetum cinerariifolium]
SITFSFPLSFTPMIGILIGYEDPIVIPLDHLVYGVTKLAMVKIALTVGKLPLTVGTQAVGRTSAGEALAAAHPLDKISAAYIKLNTFTISSVSLLPSSVLLSAPKSSLYLLSPRDWSILLSRLYTLVQSSINLCILCCILPSSTSRKGTIGDDLRGKAEVLAMFSLSCPSSKLEIVGKASPCLLSLEIDVGSSAAGEKALD